MTVKEFTEVFHRRTMVSIRANDYDEQFCMIRQEWYGEVSEIPDKYENKDILVTRVENETLVICI